MKPVIAMFAAGVVSAAAGAQPQTGGVSTASSTVVNLTHRDERAAFDGSSVNFTGRVHVEMLLTAHGPDRASGGSVSFEPGAHTAWHTHPLGQTLIVTSGIGRVQFWGGAVREMRSGDVVWIPPGVKHWHGAVPESSMTHIAIAEQLDGQSVTWLEKVSATQYAGAPEASTAVAAPSPASAPPPSRAQQLLGDIAPGLAQLTDDVLFGDVWNRPGLSRRDRSLVTISALVAMNRPDQLRSHLALARQNGLTQEELIEAMTHLAFYAGWPSGVAGALVAKDVFRAP